MDLGQVAYEAYYANVGGRSAVSGQPLPAWGDQQAPILAAWRAAAGAVQEALRPPVSVVKPDRPPVAESGVSASPDGRR